MPGLILITIWSVVAPVVVLERPPGLGALRRSRELVRGNGWQVFGVIVVLVIGVGIVAAVIEGIGELAGTGAGIVVRVIVQILTAPLSALAASVLYFKLRDASADAPAEGVPVGNGLSLLRRPGRPSAVGPAARSAAGCPPGPPLSRSSRRTCRR